MNTAINEPFGAYAPSRSVFLLDAITKSGISRGALRKWVAGRWRKKGFEVVDTTVRGVKYRLHIKDNTTDAKVLTSSEFYDKAEIQFLAKGIDFASSSVPQSESTFVDVGANTGYYSLNLCHLGYARVIAIEPNPPTLEILRFNVACNEMESTINVVPLCIGDGEPVPFYNSSGLGSASVIKPSHDSEPILVPSMSLLDILKQNDVKQVHGLKIDVEGFEDRALLPFFESAPKDLWPRLIVIEDCHQDLWETNVLDHLASIGYQKSGQTRGNQLLERMGGG